MSAFVVDKPHIDFLVEAALRAYPVHPGNARKLSWWRVDDAGQYDGWNEVATDAEHREGDEYRQYVTPSQLGQMLTDANVLSVHHRYPDTSPDEGDLPGPCDAYYMGPYIFAEPRKQITPGQVFKAIDCLDYQSCEHDSWTSSEAYSFLRSLRKAYCDRVADYEEAPWEIVA